MENISGIANIETGIEKIVKINTGLIAVLNMKTLEKDLYMQKEIGGEVMVDYGPGS